MNLCNEVIIYDYTAPYRGNGVGIKDQIETVNIN